MTKQWILVANSSIARIFVRNSRSELKAALSRPVDQRVEVSQDIDFSALDAGEIKTRIQGISRPAF